jgi:hypothetical protein
MKVRRITVVAFLTGTLSMAGCKARSGRTSEDSDSRAVSIDLTKVAPMGFEISGDHPLAVPRGKVNLTIRLPERIEIPSDQQKWGAEAIVFRPGRYEVDLYKNLQYERLLRMRAPVSIENGVPTAKVKLDTGKLSNGQCVLGISGDPFFAYCPVQLQ